jgi:hypothetical protein
VEPVLATYPVTHLPGNNAFKINMNMIIRNGAKNPVILLIAKTKG